MSHCLTFFSSIFFPSPFALSLSLSLALFFLPSFFCFFFYFLLFPCFCLFLSFSSFLSFCFMKRRTLENYIWRFFPDNPFCFVGVLSCLFFQILLPYLSFLFVSYVFSSRQMVLGFKQDKKHQFLVKGGVATKRFFNNLCFAKSEKLSFLGGANFCQHVVASIKHYKNRYFQHLFRSKKSKT